MVTCGTVASTSPTRSTLLLLPATSLTLAVTVTVPSASAPTSAAGTLSCQVPSLFTVVCQVLPFSVTVTVWPACASLVPLSSRSCCASAALMMLSSVRLSSVMDGGNVSTVTTRDASALLPLTLVTLTLTCARPSISVSMALAGTVRLQLPSCCTWAVKVWSANFTTTVCPASTPCVWPESVRSAPFSAALSMSSLVTESMVTATALRSSSMGRSAETVLPQASSALACTAIFSGLPALKIGRSARQFASSRWRSPTAAVVNVVDGHHDLRPFGQMGAGAGDGQIGAAAQWH
ncbi:Uncharacterised protein [Enterobacter cancerogenus]|uniref:Uncharacterized protein n=1 Tax=Enterobacter cancerogenus TaxID=69218 RepID=A0A484Z2V2_9ENTR|nr:Uncharacterised protein [Enterobacter cancerogenus]